MSERILDEILKWIYENQIVEEFVKEFLRKFLEEKDRYFLKKFLKKYLDGLNTRSRYSKNLRLPME